MESSKFTYNGFGINDSVLGGGYALYAGYAEGLRSDRDLQNHYKGKAFVETRGFDIPVIADEISLGLGGTISTSVSDWKLKTYTAYVSGGGSLGLPLVDIGYGVVDYIPSGVSRHYGKSGEFASMITDMVSGKYSPYPQSIQPPSALYSIRGYFAVLAAKYSVVYMEMDNERTRSENLSK